MTEEDFVCELGVGRLLLAGDLPSTLELPDGRAAAPCRRPATRRAAGRADSSATSPASPSTFDLDVDAYGAAHGFTDFERDVYKALAPCPTATR